ncbi:helix-turn-helix domain-containing protein [Solicola sp. PLA-1-18]|uniref:helix-turn-helix domain-containing protein n=1 Tax=Solicola sp. PLA-1-18 TaxID=3380532 RepID=UPI003B7E1BA2
MLTNVAAVVLDDAEPFGIGVLNEVWNEPHHPEDDCPTFDFDFCTDVPGRVRSSSGMDLHVEHGLERLAEADLVAVAAKRDYSQVSDAVVEALQAAHARGARVLASCSAVFTLGAAGLLDGRRCTTHWRYAERLQAAYPLAHVEPDVLYVEDERVVTGAGSAAGIDACLHVMREEFGSRVAATTARRMVVPPHRDGGQAQYVRTPIVATTADTLEPVLAWAGEHLDEDLSVEVLARRAHMSARTFARRFRDETGTTPHQWVTTQRVALAEEMLETTGLAVEQVARRAGFGNAATLRHHFGQVRGTTPQAYRTTFGARGA